VEYLLFHDTGESQAVDIGWIKQKDDSFPQKPPLFHNCFTLACGWKKPVVVGNSAVFAHIWSVYYYY